MSGFLPVLAGCAGVRLVSVRWLSCWVLAWFLSVFSFSFCLFPLAAGVTFQLPDGRDVGSNARAPTQEPVEAPTLKLAFSGIPPRTTVLFTSSRLACSFPCTLLFYYGGPSIAFLVCWNFFGRLDSGSASFSSTWSSNGSFAQATSSYLPVVFLLLPVVPNHTASVPVFTRKPEDSFLAQ